jgi:methionyl-tRNA formyltransferase
MRIVFAGTPEFAVPPLAALLDSAHEVVGVLTQPDRPAGRGRRLAESAVKEFMHGKGVPIDQPATLRTPEGRRMLEQWRPDVLVVVAYGLILPPEVLAIPRLGCINIHGSILPRWRGAAPIQRALLAGDEETGVTIMMMDEGLDTGPVLLERRGAISAEDDSASLHAKLSTLGADALLEALAGLETGVCQPHPQLTAGAIYAKKITKEEALIDWRESARLIERRIRAFRPWPMAYTLRPRDAEGVQGESLRLHRASVLRVDALPADLAQRRAGAAPGTVLGTHEGMLVIACGEALETDCLGICELQRAGRRVVTAREFANATITDGEVWGS